MQFDFSMVKDILEMMKIGDLVEILILAFWCTTLFSGSGTARRGP